MTILTERQVWRRTPPRRKRLRSLTPDEQANVRRVLQHLTIDHVSSSSLASALGITRGALEKLRSPSRPPSVRVALAVARLVGAGVDDIFAGRWRQHTCDGCGTITTV